MSEKSPLIIVECNKTARDCLDRKRRLIKAVRNQTLDELYDLTFEIDRDFECLEKDFKKCEYENCPLKVTDKLRKIIKNLRNKEEVGE